MFNTPTTAVVADAMPLTLLDWHPFAKDAPRGFAKNRLGRTLVINEIPVPQSNGKVWAALPSKPLIASNGTALRDGQEKQRYAPILKWSSRETADRFSGTMLAAIHRDHGPDVAAEEAA